MKKASKVTDRKEMTVKLTTDKFLYFPRQILHDTRVKKCYTKLVYIALVDAIDSRNDKDEELHDTAKISQNSLAEMALVSVPVVKNAIEELIELGYVEVLESEVGFQKIYKVNREPMEITLSSTDTLMTVCKKGIKAECKKLGIELENGDTVKMQWRKDVDGKYPVFTEDFLRELVEKAEDTPADKPVENAPAKTSNAEDVPARDLSRKEEVESSPARKTSNLVNRRPKRKYYFEYLIYSTQQITRRFVDIQRDEYGNDFVYLKDFPDEIRKNLRDKQAKRLQYACPDYANVTNKIWKDFEGRVY